ncbi:hypothetical protein KJ765_01555 [Candidatus Micrarchaeota archaeon]|nr:hypothetical protein [Candidatus Micrarchaeota archaeon]
MRRAQTATEYLILVAGVIFFTLFMFLVIKGELIPSIEDKTGGETAHFLDEFGKPYRLYESYDVGNAYKWKVKSGTWDVDNGEYVQQDNTRGISIVGDSTWNQYAVEALIKRTNAAGTAGVIARFTGQEYYDCVVENNVLKLRRYKVTGDTYNDLASAILSPDPESKWFLIKITVEGENIRCSSGGTEISVVDFDFPSGEAGLISINSEVRFDDVRITELPQLDYFPVAPSPSCAGVCLDDCNNYLSCSLDAGGSCTGSDVCCIGTCTPNLILYSNYSTECLNGKWWRFTWDSNLTSDSNGSYSRFFSPGVWTSGFNPAAVARHVITLPPSCALMAGDHFICNMTSCTNPPDAQCESLIKDPC